MSTNIGELAEFFPAGQSQAKKPTAVRVPPMQPGETPEQARQRQDARTARIKAQIANKGAK